MEFKEISTVDSRDFDDALKIYLEAFPRNERHPENIISERVRQGTNKLYVATLNDEIAFLGLLWPLKDTDFILLDYIATKDTHRGKGIASAFLKTLRTRLMDEGRHLILEVENPKFGDRVQEKERRVAFYKRQGARELEGVRYLLPPLEGNIPTEMILMMFCEFSQENIDATTVRNLIIQIYRELYGREGDDALLVTFVDDIRDTIKLI